MKFESIIVKLASNVLLVVRAGGVGSVQAVHSVHSLPLHPPGEGLVDAQSVARGVLVLHLNPRPGKTKPTQTRTFSPGYRSPQLVLAVDYNPLFLFLIANLSTGISTSS